jgi:hypothetical protein
VLWGDSDQVCPAQWGDKLGDYFSNLKFTTAKGRPLRTLRAGRLVE